MGAMEVPGMIVENKRQSNLCAMPVSLILDIGECGMQDTLGDEDESSMAKATLYIDFC
jgi:hypothetical protein